MCARAHVREYRVSCARAQASIYKLNDALQQRNLPTCPTNCSCNQVSACGVPYPVPPPPPPPPLAPGAPITMEDCASATRWTTQPVSGAAGAYRIASVGEATPLCWDQPHTGCTACLVLAPCAGASTFNHTHDGAFVNTATEECVDMSGDGLGSWKCGAGQPNQRFALDAFTGMLASTAAGYNAETSEAGECASAGGSPDH